MFDDIIKELAGESTEAWKKEWKGMPEFIQNDLEPWKQLIVNFESEQDMLAFAKLVDQKITYKTPSIWFPKAEIACAVDKIWTDINHQGDAK